MAYTKAEKERYEKRLSAVYRECIEELDVLDIPYGNITKVEVNYRAKSRWGLCKRMASAYETKYEIQISVDLLMSNATEKGLKETVIHEILHTCPNCMCHTGEWKRLADLVNDCYNYNVKRTNTAEDKGLDENEVMKRRVTSTPKYVFKCKGCGAFCVKTRACDFTRYPYLYYCKRCGGNFVKISADEYVKAVANSR